MSVTYGTGKRYPGLSISIEGEEFPVYFDASENASMTSRILRNSLAKIDSLGLTKRGPGLWPAIFLTGTLLEPRG